MGHMGTYMLHVPLHVFQLILHGILPKCYWGLLSLSMFIRRSTVCFKWYSWIFEHLAKCTNSHCQCLWCSNVYWSGLCIHSTLTISHLFDILISNWKSKKISLFLDLWENHNFKNSQKVPCDRSKYPLQIFKCHCIKIVEPVCHKWTICFSTNFLNGHSSDTRQKKKVCSINLHVVIHLFQFMAQNSEIWGLKNLKIFLTSQKSALFCPANGQLVSYSKIQTKVCRTP